MNATTPSSANSPQIETVCSDAALFPSPSGDKTRVYLVDDHALTRMGLRTMIDAESDMEVCGETADPATAMVDIAALKPHVVVSDISLRNGSGIELTKNIKAFSPAIDVVIVSIHDESVYAMRVLKAGARAYVMKEDAVNRVLDAIRRVRRGELCVSDRVATEILKRCVAGSPPDETDLPVRRLSNRELEIVSLIGEGMPTRQIAAKLLLSVKTVETHRVHVKRKLGLVHSSQLVQFCVRWVEEAKSMPHRADAAHIAGFPTLLPLRPPADFQRSNT